MQNTVYRLVMPLAEALHAWSAVTLVPLVRGLFCKGFCKGSLARPVESLRAVPTADVSPFPFADLLAHSIIKLLQCAMVRQYGRY